MRNCKECNKEFEERKSFELYCTIKCRKKCNQRKRVQRYQNNPLIKDFKNKTERERRKRVGRLRDRCPIARKKESDEQRLRYRKKHGINSDTDLKNAPKGSGTITKYGYRQIICHDHPNSRKDGQIFEHVFVMSNYLKRPLTKGETVHHKNGIKHDNRIENLELWSSSHPYGQRIEDKVKWCKEFLEEYGYKVIIEKNE